MTPEILRCGIPPDITQRIIKDKMCKRTCRKVGNLASQSEDCEAKFFHHLCHTIDGQTQQMLGAHHLISRVGAMF